MLQKGTIVGQVKAVNIIPPLLGSKDESTYYDISEYESEYESKNDILQYVLKQSSVAHNLPQPSQERLDKIFSKLDLSGTKDWDEFDQQRVGELIKKFHHIFTLEDTELGSTDIVEHEIKLSDPKPFKGQYHRIPPTQYEGVRAHLQETLKVGAIRKSVSPWASPVVLVWKKDGSLRYGIDSQKLNARMIRDAYSLPRIEESLDFFNGACIFTSLDLKASYWQVKMSEESIPYTAFMVGPLGFYECVRMPFRLTNASATFQHLMESCLGDLHLQYCIIYLDDIIIFSKTPSEHLDRLKAVFAKIVEAGLRLKPKKCEFFKTCVEYLGHIVSKNGIEMNPKIIKVIVKWPRSSTVTEVRSFLGFCNYYRMFIYQYAQVAKPLYKLVSWDNAKKNNSKIEWSRKCEEAFLKLKQICTNTPVLAYANYKKPFWVHTDASELGLDVVLYQKQEDGTRHVIAYAS